MSKLSDSEIFITGANGQLGTALRAHYPNARFADVDELDITSREAVDAFDWSGIKVVINAAAYTNVDGAETSEGRVAAWKVNAQAIKHLSYCFRQHKMNTFVHISSDYVFDGTAQEHREDESFSPLSAYGATKAAGDLLAAQLDEHYIIRTSWVVGEGKNFVRTMLELADKGIDPSVVSDQIGRLTFTSELVRAIDYLLASRAPFGTYNVSNSGEPASWADITREIFVQAGLSNKVSDVTTEQYYAGKSGYAPRPLNSTLNLAKIQTTGFEPVDWRTDLADYIKRQTKQ